jgi:hypothetical protein
MYVGLTDRFLSPPRIGSTRGYANFTGKGIISVLDISKD